MDHYSNSELDGYTIGDYEQDQRLDRQDDGRSTLDTARAQAGITLRKVGGDYLVLVDGRCVGVYWPRRWAEQVADELALDLIASGAIGEIECTA